MNVSLTSRPFPIAFSTQTHKKKHRISYLFTNDERFSIPALSFKLPGEPYYTVRPYVIPETGSLHHLYEGWNFNSGNYLFTTDTK